MAAACWMFCISIHLRRVFLVGRWHHTVCNIWRSPHPGKAHIRRAIRGHEEALRIYGLCHHLNKMDVLQDILQASHQRSLNKCSINENDEEFADYTEAPDIICESVFQPMETSCSALEAVFVMCIWESVAQVLVSPHERHAGPVSCSVSIIKRLLCRVAHLLQ